MDLSICTKGISMHALAQETPMHASALDSKFYEDLSLGMSEIVMKTVTDKDVVTFAAVSGDNNPIHLSDDYASKTRFGQRIAHGLYTASLISAVIGTRLPGPGAVYISQTLNFKGPVKIGDVVCVRVEVKELLAERRRAVLHCECLVDGSVVLDGEALVMVPARPKAVEAA
jgi:3-hydroxybutyryl-CoA dehydratase